MRKAALFYNPLSGRRRERRLADVRAALAVLQQAGIEATAEPTRGQADAAEQARHAIAGGCDTILACGGDGTAHDVLQGMAGSQAALGVIPLGTANALAHDLGLPLNAVGAARALLTAKPRRIALGRVEYTDLEGNRGSRFFTVAAGIGADAHLFYKLNPLVKGHLGMAAYYAKATRLWLTHPMEKFAVEMHTDSPNSDGFAERGFATAVGSHPQLWRRAARTGTGGCARPQRLTSGAFSHPQPLGLSAIHHQRTGGSAMERQRNRPGAQPENRLPAPG